ncbi:MAG: capsular biosynthesis protein [Bacteroidales bacterium]|nr:capsular biosynthesis protein [Bacteroidales bacterium]
MSIFTPVTSLERCSFFEGYTDCHCHILPGVDDGFKTLEDSLEVLDIYYQAGIRKVWLTPHIMEEMPNSTGHLRDVFAMLKESYKGGVELHLAAENMLDIVFDNRFRENDLLTLPGDRILVETSYFNPPIDLHSILARIRATGLNPVLAHPERYMYLKMEDYPPLKNEGILFQLNLLSLTGAYGNSVRIKAETMLKNGMYDFSGTDLHRISAFDTVSQSRIPKKIASLIPRNDNL